MVKLVTNKCERSFTQFSLALEHVDRVVRYEHEERQPQAFSQQEDEASVDHRMRKERDEPNFEWIVTGVFRLGQEVALQGEVCQEVNEEQHEPGGEEQLDVSRHDEEKKKGIKEGIREGINPP